MKKILILLAIILISGCDPNKGIPDVSDEKGQYDPNAMILLKPDKGVQLRSSIPNLTALQVVEQALNIKWQSHWFGNKFWDDVKDISRSFPDQYKDFNIPALKMLGTDIISDAEEPLGEGEYYRDFIYGFNVFITDSNNDTIAYVPDSVINAARPLIETAFADSNYSEVYRLFNEAFTFLPIE